MARGLDKYQEYRVVYRMLKGILRELRAAGVPAVYNRRKVSAVDSSGKSSLSVTCIRMNASNGECCIYPCIAITVAGLTTYYAPYRTEQSYETGMVTAKELFLSPAMRLEYLRGELRAERISYGELAELQSLARFIQPGDVELLEAAGVPERAADGAEMTELERQYPVAMFGVVGYC